MSDYKKGFEFSDKDIKTKEKNNDALMHRYFKDVLNEDEYRQGFVIDEKIESRDINATDVPDEELTSVTFDSDEDNAEVLRTRFWSSPVFWFLILVVAVGGLQVYDLISTAFAKSTLAGWCWSGGISLALLLVIVSVFRELGSVWQLKNTYKYRQLYEKINEQGNGSEAIELCKNLITKDNPLVKAGFEIFLKRVQPNFTAKEVFELYERTVLSLLDKKAKDIVVKRSRETGVVVALSPIAWLDMAFSLARSLRMVREIASVYGYHCGLWGRLQLYKKIIRNVVFIGIADLTTDAVTDALGAKTFAKLSASVGQGLAAGVYSTRLGYMTIKAIRPLPISKEKLSLGNLRKEMITGALKVLDNHENTDRKI